MNPSIVTSMLRSMVLAVALCAAPVSVMAAEAGQRPTAQDKAEAKAEKKAEALLEKAIKTLEAKGLKALKPQIPALSKALDAAPADWSRLQVSISGGGETPEAQAFTAFLQQTLNAELTNTYPDIALMVGSYHVETGQMETAVRTLDKGLALDRGNPVLLSEKGVALSALGRFADAVAAYDAGIAAGRGSAEEAARLHRGRGVALIDLKRLDEAEAALKTSLELQPNHPMALNELKYITQIRAGAEPTAPIKVMTADEAAKQPLN